MNIRSKKGGTELSFKHRFILKASVGFSLGILVTILINIIMSYIYTGNGESFVQEVVNAGGGRSLRRFCAELLSGGLLGLIGNGGSMVYEIESWSLLKTTTVHFGATIVTYIAVGLYNGWLTLGPSRANSIQIGIYITAYVVIWLVQGLTYKKEIEDINYGISVLKSRENLRGMKPQ